MINDNYYNNEDLLGLIIIVRLHGLWVQSYVL